MQNGFQEPLDPFQSPIQGPEDHHTDSHHDNECAVEGLSWNQRRELWKHNKAGEYRWDSYRVDGGLHYAMKGTNTHSSNMLYMYVKGASHNEMGRGFGNSRISGSYTIIKKKHVNNMEVGSAYSVWSLGHYDCDCSEGYYIRDHWGSGSAWVIFTDNSDSGYGVCRGGHWDNPNHSNH